MSTKTSAKIRMFRLNELGDCFLVTFAVGDDRSDLLIDCGSFRNNYRSKNRLQAITKGIQKLLDGKQLDVVVGTHQHNDHVSGFLHCEDEFREIGVGQVWLSWLDDPRDKRAQRIGEDFNNVRAHLTAARDAFRSTGRIPTAARSAVAVLEDVLGFYGASKTGAPPATPAEAVEVLKKIGKQMPLFLKPGRTLDMPGVPAGSVRVHVLAPPRNTNSEGQGDPLLRKNPRKGESYDAFAAAGLHSSRFLQATKRLKHPTGKKSREEEHYPFNKAHQRKQAGPGTPLAKVMRNYKARSEAWRKIDHDWMQQAESLALYLDTFTNNSSLVLAIELVASGKVLLFAADAQAGSWASWKDVQWEDKSVSTDDLLARTVFYKVGHHASHNATLVEAFEKMDHPDLVALIPVHKKDSNITKSNGWKMPAKNLFKKLVEHTNHRVLQMDNINPPDCDPNKNPAKAAWKRVGIKPKIESLAIEIEIRG